MMLGVVLVTLCIALIALVSGWRVRSTGEFTVAGGAPTGAWFRASLSALWSAGPPLLVPRRRRSFMAWRPGGSRWARVSVAWCWQPCSPSPCGARTWKPYRNSWSARSAIRSGHSSRCPTVSGSS